MLMKLPAANHANSHLIWKRAKSFQRLIQMLFLQDYILIEKKILKRIETIDRNLRSLGLLSD